MRAEQKPASLRLTLGDTVLQELLLTKERVTLGRRPHNDMVLDHAAVSAEHAAIVTIAGDSFLEDLNSTNGTLVNGQPVKKHFLQHGDVIELAKYSVLYHAEPNSAAGAGGSRRRARIKVLTGASAGRELLLTKPLTSFGRPGVQVAVILERPHDYCIAHIEGEVAPRLNGKAVGSTATPLASGDIIELSGTQLLFALD